MRAQIYQLDAFTAHRFAGNPASVVVLPHFLDDTTLQAIASENNVAETAFIVAGGDEYHLRWFTPLMEVPLCGHATLASAAVVMERLQPARNHVTFHSASGPLAVKRKANAYVMDFPSRQPRPITPPFLLLEALRILPMETYDDAFNYLIRFDDENKVRQLRPDMSLLNKLERSGVVVTARGSGRYDFVSRYFAPQKGIPEDPVTGGAHCGLTPFWSSRLNKKEFIAYQASARGGELRCRLAGDRVHLEGECAFYMAGEIEI